MSQPVTLSAQLRAKLSAGEVLYAPRAQTYLTRIHDHSDAAYGLPLDSLDQQQLRAAAQAGMLSLHYPAYDALAVVSLKGESL